MKSGDHIAILMCTYNGAKHLQDQLDSFAAQTHENWSLWVSDDGSTDETRSILDDFNKHSGKRVEWIEGPRKGFCANFLSLMCWKIEADCFAISDQDDIWLSEKLERALNKMKETGAALYGGRTKAIDEKGKAIGLTPLFKNPPSFQNALVQSIMGGNTIVLDPRVISLVREAGQVDVVSHDWWIYILTTGAGLPVYYDSEPMLLYRQTGQNLVGSNQGLRAKLKRVRRLLRNEFREWNGKNVKALEQNPSALNPESRVIFEAFATLRKNAGIAAIRELSRIGLSRQTRRGRLALMLAVFLGKL